jgi:hypothetical protein
MQYVGRCLNFTFLPVASNDNDDLLAFAVPSFDLSIIRGIKHEMREENAETGMLLCSRKDRLFFQEVVDAERYIVLRYFTNATPEEVLRRLKRHILDNYLFPKIKRRKKTTPVPAD